MGGEGGERVEGRNGMVGDRGDRYGMVGDKVG